MKQQRAIENPQVVFVDEIAPAPGQPVQAPTTIKNPEAVIEDEFAQLPVQTMQQQAYAAKVEQAALFFSRFSR